MQDGQGLDVANADGQAIEAIDVLREEWLGFGTAIDRFRMLADTEEKCALVPALAATLALASNAPGSHDLAVRLLARAHTLARAIGARERLWLDAAQAWLAGNADKSLALYGKIVADWPRDVLAGRIGQTLALILGDAEALLRIGARVAAADPAGRFVNGLHAFGLAECHRLDEAEALARTALAIERTDASAHAALTQCFAARGRLAEGVTFLDAATGWPESAGHLATLLIDLDRTDEALALVDARIEALNAIAPLARLELRGVDVGDRWTTTVAALADRSREPSLPVLDLQHLYALARAGTSSAVTEMLAALEDRAEHAKPFEREAWADAAVPAAHGLVAHARGDQAEAARLLGQALPHLPTIGGTRAQRAVFGAIHLDALTRAGWNDAALKILQADERERPSVPATKRALADLYRKLGRAEQAMTADYQAEQLVRQYRSAA